MSIPTETEVIKIKSVCLSPAVGNNWSYLLSLFISVYSLWKNILLIVDLVHQIFILLFEE